MTNKRKWFITVSSIVFAFTMIVYLVVFNTSMTTIQSDIEKDYQTVSHINAKDFSQLNSNQIVVFDVREPEEYAVSHIEGAIQVAPNISADDFIDEYAELLKGKQLVFYCSVGRRSSALVSKLDDELIKLGATSSFNLMGGVFSWVNDDRQLSSSAQIITNKVHPFNSFWGRLIEDQSKVSYEVN